MSPRPAHSSHITRAHCLSLPTTATDLGRGAHKKDPAPREGTGPGPSIRGGGKDGGARLRSPPPP